jgi:hypothetical protein
MVNLVVIFVLIFAENDPMLMPFWISRRREF